MSRKTRLIGVIVLLFIAGRPPGDHAISMC